MRIRCSMAMLSALVLGWLLFWGATPATAISLEFVPLNPTVTVGASLTVDVVVKDLGTTLVGGYDIIVDWDDAFLSLAGVPTIGTSLGAPADSLVSIVSLPPDQINVAETSLLSSTDLDALQNGDIILFSLSFTAISAGLSPLHLIGNIGGPGGDFLSDDIGAVIPVTSVDGSVTVNPAVPGQIPEPGTIVLLGTGLAGLLGYGWRRRQRAV